jgi:hypothetical protein
MAKRSALIRSGLARRDDHQGLDSAATIEHHQAQVKATKKKAWATTKALKNLGQPRIPPGSPPRQPLRTSKSYQVQRPCPRSPSRIRIDWDAAITGAAVMGVSRNRSMSRRGKPNPAQDLYYLDNKHY